MVQSKPRFATFEEYLTHSSEVGLEGYYELINGELVELPTESGLNKRIAVKLLLLLTTQGILPDLIYPNGCELQVPVIRPEDPANRFPDLVVLREEHLQLTRLRLTVTLDMPPPDLVVEVVSPGQTNQERDYVHKRNQYAAREIPEYWIVNPEEQTILVLSLKGNLYVEVGTFQGNTPIVSPAFPALILTPEQIFNS